MVKIIPPSKIFLSIFWLIFPTLSMEKKPSLSRSGAEYNLFAGFASTLGMKETLFKSESDLFAKPFPITSVEVTFPAESKKLEEAIKKQTTRVKIYIPRMGKIQSEQTKIECLKYDFNDVSCITHLCVYHSIGNDRGYWKSAVEALIPFIYSAQNLQRITLSHGIVEGLLPIIDKKIRIIVDCSCAYSVTDTIYPQTCLENIRDAQVAALAEKYPNRNITVLKAANSEDLFSSGNFKS